MPDLTRFFFSKEGLDHIVPNWPRSDQDGLVRFWPDASGPKVSRCARIVRPGSGRMQPASVVDLHQRHMSLQPFPLVAFYFSCLSYIHQQHIF